MQAPIQPARRYLGKGIEMIEALKNFRDRARWGVEWVQYEYCGSTAGKAAALAKAKAELAKAEADLAAAEAA